MKKICLGYTLIELLVVSSLAAIIFIIGFASYTQFNRSQILEQATQELKNNLRLAQSKAISGEKPAGCGSLYGYQVEFFPAVEKDSYEIRPKCDQGTLPALPGEIYSLPASVRFDPKTSPYPPSPVFFKVLAQGVADAREITLTGYNLTRKITVTTNGEIR